MAKNKRILLASAFFVIILILFSLITAAEPYEPVNLFQPDAYTIYTDFQNLVIDNGDGTLTIMTALQSGGPIYEGSFDYLTPGKYVFTSVGVGVNMLFNFMYSDGSYKYVELAEGGLCVMEITSGIKSGTIILLKCSSESYPVTFQPALYRYDDWINSQMGGSAQLGYDSGYIQGEADGIIKGYKEGLSDYQLTSDYSLALQESYIKGYEYGCQVTKDESFNLAVLIVPTILSAAALCVTVLISRYILKKRRGRNKQ